jgi:site-specific DNA-methyltransferase (adenine-specific)
MIQLIKGECIEAMKLIPSGSIDAIITDPPYGTTACKWDSVIPFEPMWEQLNRIIKPNGAIVLFGGQPFTSALVMSNPKYFKQELIWNKITPVGHLLVKKRIMQVHENILLFWKKQPTFNRQMKDKPMKDRRPNKYKNNIKIKESHKTELVENCPQSRYAKDNDDSKVNPKSIININKNRKNKVHPTQKPIELMEYLIKTYTNEGETVLDFTMGSGSTGVAAKNLNRNFIGIELDDKYFEIAKERIND